MRFIVGEQDHLSTCIYQPKIVPVSQITEKISE